MGKCILNIKIYKRCAVECGWITPSLGQSLLFNLEDNSSSQSLYASTKEIISTGDCKTITFPNSTGSTMCFDINVKNIDENYCDFELKEICGYAHELHIQRNLQQEITLRSLIITEHVFTAIIEVADINEQFATANQSVNKYNLSITLSSRNGRSTIIRQPRKWWQKLLRRPAKIKYISNDFPRLEGVGDAVIQQGKKTQIAVLCMQEGKVYFYANLLQITNDGYDIELTEPSGNIHKLHIDHDSYKRITLLSHDMGRISIADIDICPVQED